MIAVSARRSTTVLTTAVIGGLVAAGTLVAVPSADAAPTARTEKVRICHRTNSLTNPYVSIEVAESSVDGDDGNDRGRGDHYANHTGPVWTPATTKNQDWGDIIPPIAGVHDGRNWTEVGRAIWTAGCQPTEMADEDGDNVPDVTDPDVDGDRVPDVTDPDDDGDRVPDVTDPDEDPTRDTDGDTVPDPDDSDDDGDGLTDNAECEAKAPEPTAATDGAPEQPTASATTEAVPAADASSTPGNNAATGVGQTTTGAGATGRAVCGEPVQPPREDEADTDGDGTPNETDRDDDGDSISDVRDPDQDGDANPDVTDPDDDGDGVPDPLDEDRPPLEPSNVVDTDGDGTPDSRDRDDDGDGVSDARDVDADGDGRPEVTPQPLSGEVVLPARIVAGEPTLLLRGEPDTVAGVPALATIACMPTMRAGMKAPSGDIGADQMTRMLCRVDKGGPTTRITVRGEVPTTVVVTFRASAVGDYLALTEVRTYRVVAR